MPKTATATPTKVHWRAPAEDGVGHAFTAGRALPAVCGLRWTHPRWDWPRRSYHEACVAALALADAETPAPPRMPRR